jgi:plastocyanin
MRRIRDLRHSWRHQARAIPGAALLLTLAVLAAPTAAARALAPAAVVDIRDSRYLPSVLSVPMGTTVRWTNHDEETHTVTSDTGLFGSAGLDLDEAYTYTFTAPGQYAYGCDLHPFMHGTIVVQ